MNVPDQAAPRNPWPIGRFLAHSHPCASGRRSLALGEKSQSATLRSKECGRNRSECHCRFEIGIAFCRRPSVLHSSNRGAADLDAFAIAHESLLNAHGSEWRKRRIIGRIRLRRSGWTVPFSSVNFRAFRSKKTAGKRTDGQPVVERLRQKPARAISFREANSRNEQEQRTQQEQEGATWSTASS